METMGDILDRFLGVETMMRHNFFNRKDGTHLHSGGRDFISMVSDAGNIYFFEGSTGQLVFPFYLGL